jgi:hypothetical protein
MVLVFLAAYRLPLAQRSMANSIYDFSVPSLPNVVDVDVNRLPRRPGETLGEYDARVRRNVAEFTLRYPQIVAQFVSAHFFITK